MYGGITGYDLGVLGGSPYTPLVDPFDINVLYEFTPCAEVCGRQTGFRKA